MDSEHPPEEFRRSRCGGKVCYFKREAQAVRNQRRKSRRKQKRNSPVKDLRIYQCPHCNFFHLTKSL